LNRGAGEGKAASRHFGWRNFDENKGGGGKEERGEEGRFPANRLIFQGCTRIPARKVRKGGGGGEGNCDGLYSLRSPLLKPIRPTLLGGRGEEREGREEKKEPRSSLELSIRGPDVPYISAPLCGQEKKREGEEKEKKGKGRRKERDRNQNHPPRDANLSGTVREKAEERKKGRKRRRNR